ncbi:MAG: type IV pilus modification protein PilV [Telluria sp.]
MKTTSFSPRQAGTTLLEVLVTLVIVAFGLLGIAAIQGKSQVGSIESYQRAQAVILLQDMQARMVGNPDHAADYVTDAAHPLGTGSSVGTDCSSVAAGSAYDLCEWSQALQGAAESIAATSTTTTKVGAMVGARGCIEAVQAANPTSGICTPAIYQISVSWQGMHDTLAPASGLTCGQDQYGRETLRRTISTRVAVPMPTC